jgi:2-polyprenyl-3-methyl-5-hydroxy-6-metoxy-1,4-benzoquinol methylase
MVSDKCRFCNYDLNTIFIDLGSSPLANSYLKKNDFLKEKFYSLCTFLCQNCFLVQLKELETPENIFSDYAYFSSFSTSWLKHAKDYVDMIIPRLSLDKNSLVVEIASNDGYLLQNFIGKNIPVMGIEPAQNIAKESIKKNIPTLTNFFDSQLAKNLVSENKTADLIIGNNVFAHIPCLNDFIIGLKILLKPTGIITLEFPHLLQLMKNNQFDTIYHEHFSYFSLITVKKILEHHGLKIFDVEELTTHGGSLRLFITHFNNDQVNETLESNLVIEEEKKFGLTQIDTYEKFLKNIIKIKTSLTNFIENAKKDSKHIICYGAPAKGNTLLNYCELSKNQIDYTVDKNPSKQNLFLPGTHIPIFSPDKIKETKPDFILILPWNLKEEILNELEYVKSWGCKFIIPIPEVKVLQ